ncbi:MAG: thiamine-phosphate pyrophosphorylase [Flavobacteriales bacterium]|jgi:thiamine-phosphate pyrophosphorylase|tara:strand:+ start:3590 stop:4249 length:660 start_codon:yes stop_codon:yes gene_type:complete
MQLQIPNLHYISRGVTIQDHLDHIQKACSYGAELVQLRLKNVTEEEVLIAAKKAREITSHFQTKLIINDYYKIAKEVNADGVHLGRKDTDPEVARAFLGPYFIIGGTANTLQDCTELLKKEIDYIGLGPYQFTSTKKVLSPVLGYNGYLTILEELNTETPIIAIGGIRLSDVPEILKAGVKGIAISGAITKDFNSISQFKQVLNGDQKMDQVWKPNQQN